jgi:hypothetical protein
MVGDAKFEVSVLTIASSRGGPPLGTYSKATKSDTSIKLCKDDRIASRDFWVSIGRIHTFLTTRFCWGDGVE